MLQLLPTGGAASVAAGRISYAMALQGASVTVDTACSSSLVAAHFGSFDLMNGRAMRTLVGGVSLTLTLGKALAFSITGKFHRFMSSACFGHSSMMPAV